MYTNECREYAKHIAEEVTALYNATGEERARLEEEGEPSTLWDYLTEQALDIEYRADAEKKLIGVYVWVTIGGPSCWIDTHKARVVCSWGSDREEYPLRESVAEAITEYYREIWDC